MKGQNAAFIQSFFPSKRHLQYSILKYKGYMYRLFISFIVFFVIAQSCFAAQDKQKNIIFITIDGVRHQDFFDQKDKKFPLFWEKYAHLGELAGGPSSKTMEVAPVPVSLPSYLSMTTGKVLSCLDNDCPMVNEATFIDKIAKNHHLKPQQIAVVSTWKTIDKTVSATPRIAYINTGNQLKDISNAANDDQIMKQINQLQKVNTPFWGTEDRLDKYTYLHAIHYLHKYKPRLLWIALGDADEQAHAHHKEGYEEALLRSDYLLDDLFQTLKEMPEYAKNTTIIITTDHGRGDGENWSSHGPSFPEAKHSFLFVIDGQSILSNQKSDKQYLSQSEYTTLSIRPLIESIME